MDVSVRQLRSFVAVAKLRSFTQAAAALHISQPTLTVQIKRLEEALGLRLFDRNPRSVDLTRIGQPAASGARARVAGSQLRSARCSGHCLE